MIQSTRIATRALSRSARIVCSEIPTASLVAVPQRLRSTSQAEHGHVSTNPARNQLQGPQIRWNTTAAQGVESLLKSTINSNKITIFSKSYCPFCTRTKMLFESMGEEAMVVELDERPDGDVMQQELVNMTGQRTVPNVFINGKHLGGNDETQDAARSGTLHDLLKVT